MDNDTYTQEMQEIADGAYGDGPFRRGLARDALAATPKRRSRRRKYPHEPQTIKQIAEFSLRPWYNSYKRATAPVTLWQLQAKRSHWTASPYASIRKVKSGQAYIVTSYRIADDAFISWDDAMDEALKRARLYGKSGPMFDINITGHGVLGAQP